MMISENDLDAETIISIKKEDKEKGDKNIETLKIILNKNLPNPTKINNISSFGTHKTILGYLNAYFNHCPIKVSPNVIWQLILNNFSKYVNDNSERLREKFVDFEGKKNLTCIRIGKLEDADKYTDDIIKEYCNQISQNIGKELIDVLTPNYSTSTKESIISGQVSIMSTFKNYFIYDLLMISCGIPYIILEGNLNDWEKILVKLKFLSKYGFYISKMEKDIIEIINTKKGNININFWRKIIMETKENISESNGCSISLKKVEKSFITGWILDFYNEDKIKKEDIKDLIEEIVEVPINIIEVETQKTKTGIIYAGIRDLKQDPNNFEVEPVVDYSFSLNGKYDEKKEWENMPDLSFADYDF